MSEYHPDMSPRLPVGSRRNKASAIPGQRPAAGVQQPAHEPATGPIAPPPFPGQQPAPPMQAEHAEHAVQAVPSGHLTQQFVQAPPAPPQPYGAFPPDPFPQLPPAPQLVPPAVPNPPAMPSMPAIPMVSGVSGMEIGPGGQNAAPYGPPTGTLTLPPPTAPQVGTAPPPAPAPFVPAELPPDDQPPTGPPPPADQQQETEPAKKKWIPRWRRHRGKPAAGTGDDASTEPTSTISSADLDGMFKSQFTVPPAGGVFERTRGGSQTLKVLVPVTAAILVSSLFFLLGVGVGSSRVPAEKDIAASDIEKYGLTTFPVDTAATYGQQYLALCLSHPVDDDTAMSQRDAALRAMTTSGGVDVSCGWDGEGEASAAPSIIWNGRYDMDQTMQYEQGRVALMQYTVVFSYQSAATYVVPVWYSDDAQRSMRVAGNIGIAPLVEDGAVEDGDTVMEEDSTLNSEITTDVLTPFFTAWGDSDQVALKLVTTTDAAPITLQGLERVVSGPVVTGARTYSPKKGTGGQATQYVDGDEVTVVATVTWTTKSTGQQVTTYTVKLRKVSNRWLVFDLLPGAATGMGESAAGNTNNTATATSGPGGTDNTTTPAPTTPTDPPAPTAEPTAPPAPEPTAPTDGPEPGTDGQ